MPIAAVKNLDKGEVLTGTSQTVRVDFPVLFLQNLLTLSFLLMLILFMLQ